MSVNQYFPGNSAVYMGLSGDTKPEAGIGSKFIETDTGNVWLMLNTGAWTQIGKLSSTATPAAVI